MLKTTEYKSDAAFIHFLDPCIFSLNSYQSVLDGQWDLHVSQDFLDASNQVVQIFGKEVTNVANSKGVGVCHFSWINHLVCKKHMANTL